MTRTDWEALRRDAWARCDGLCEATGLPLTEPWDMHHRLSKRHGPDELWNLVAVNHLAHVLAPGAIHQRPRWARERGLIISKYSKVPEQVGLWLPDNRLVLLTDDGYEDIPIPQEEQGDG